jgi:hypothetical protein
MSEWWRGKGLACLCVVGPILAFCGIFGSIGGLMWSARVDCIPLAYQFRDHEAPKIKSTPAPGEKSATSKAAAAATPAKDAAATARPAILPPACPKTDSSAATEKNGKKPVAGSGQTKPQTSEADASKSPNLDLLSKDPSVKLGLVARDFAGRVSFGIASGILWLASLVLFGFGTAVIFGVKNDDGNNVAADVFSAKKPGRPYALTVLAGGAIAAVAIEIFQLLPQMQSLAFANVFHAADDHPWLMQMKVGHSALDFVRADIAIAIWAVLVLTAGLFCASVRPSSLKAIQPDARKLKTRQNLLMERMLVIKIGLILASVLLVLNVVATRTTVDWPLSLLADDAREALAPAGNVIVQQWGVLGTVALIAAFAPAIVAWHFDREDYRAATADAAAAAAPAAAQAPLPTDAAKGAGTATDAGKPPDDGLEVKLISMITSIVAMLAPMIASPLLSGLQSLFSALSK